MRFPTLKAILPLVAGVLAAGRLTAAPAPVWVPLGPFGGSVLTLTAVPSNASILYATLGQQGAFRSADGGVTWAPIHAGITTGNVVVDPTRPNTIYLAADGVQKSTDGGAHWTDLHLKHYVTSIVVDPSHPSRLYAGTNPDGIFHSLDGGASWQVAARQPLPRGDPSFVRALAIPRDGSVVYAATGAGIYKSVDEALSWQRVTSQGLPNAAITALAVAPTDPATLYAGLLDRSAQAVYRSTNGGTSWQATAGPPAPGAQSGFVISLAVFPTSPRRVWAGTDAGGLFLTTDGGAHWTVTGLQPPRPVLAIALAPSSPRTVYLGVQEQGFDLGGVFASADGGATWARRNQGLAGLDAHALAEPPAGPDVLWAGLVEQGLFRSANSGRRWARIPLPDPALKGGIPLGDIEIASSDPATLYALAFSWMWRTTDSGASWTETFTNLTGPYLGFVRVDPLDSFHLWGSGGLPAGTLLTSADGGETWTPLDPAPGLGCRVTDLRFAPSSPNIIYVAGARSGAVNCSATTAAFSRSTDGGLTWSEADNGLGGQSVGSLAVDALDPQLVYAATGGDAYPFDKGDGVWKSPDGGVTWARAGDSLQGKTITALALSPIAGVVWAAVENGGGVFRSGDGGATWQDSSAGLQAYQVYKLMVDPRELRRIYAATTGGIWTLEDH
jgi:photosystem II stability/assembly factor-like uncharacterized protein